MGIGSVLKKLLEENNKNVSELARAIDVSPQTLYSIIKRDNMKVNFDILLKICDYFHIDVENFYQKRNRNDKKNELNEQNDEITMNPEKKRTVDAMRLYNMLDRRDQIKVIYFMKGLLASEQYTAEGSEQKRLVYTAAESSDNRPDSVVETSERLMKILENAPESDEEL